MKTFKISLLFLFIFYALASCSSDDLDSEGKLHLSFYNHPDDLSIRIYTVENETIPLMDVSPNKDGVLEVGLNIGNYIIKPYSQSIDYIPSVGVQIRGKQTASVFFDENNSPHY